MPSTSKAQHNFMAAVAHSPSFAKKAGVPMSVGKDFNNADKGKTFKQGGDMATKMNPGMMAMMAKKKDGMHKMPDGKMMKNSAMKMATGGMAYAKGGGIEAKGKTKGKMIKMLGGGKC